MLIGCAQPANGEQPASGSMALAAASAAASKRPAKAIDDQEPGVTAQLRDVLQKMADGSITPEPFTERAVAALFPGQIRNYGERLHGLGALQGMELLSRTVDGENRVYQYRLLYQNGKMILDVIYGKSARINQLALSPE